MSRVLRGGNMSEVVNASSKLFRSSFIDVFESSSPKQIYNKIVYNDINLRAVDACYNNCCEETANTID